MRPDAEIRRRIDGTVEHLRRVEACLWPPSGPKEFHGYEFPTEMPMVIAMSQDGTKHIFRRDTYCLSRKIDRQIYETNWWTVLAYCGPHINLK